METKAKVDIKEWEFDKLSKEQKKLFKIVYKGVVAVYKDSPISSPKRAITIPKCLYDNPCGNDPLLFDVFREFYLKS